MCNIKNLFLSRTVTGVGGYNWWERDDWFVGVPVNNDSFGNNYGDYSSYAEGSSSGGKDAETEGENALLCYVCQSRKSTGVQFSVHGYSHPVLA